MFIMQQRFVCDLVTNITFEKCIVATVLNQKQDEFFSLNLVLKYVRSS